MHSVRTCKCLIGGFFSITDVPGYSVRDGSCPSNTLETIRYSTIRECRARCDKHISCRAFQYLDFGNTCILKARSCSMVKERPQSFIYDRCKLINGTKFILCRLFSYIVYITWHQYFSWVGLDIWTNSLRIPSTSRITLYPTIQSNGILFDVIIILKDAWYR